MNELLIVLIVVVALVAFTFGFSYFCFLITFYNKKQAPKNHFSLPPGKEYLPYEEDFKLWRESVNKLPKKEYMIKSFDGLTLYGYYYEYDKNAPIELMFHGYRGSADRDMCGAVLRSFKAKHNAFIVDHRASGKSEGKVISFGINESRDCVSWVNFLVETFGEQVKIILTGISMGAATVLISSNLTLPKNVKYVLADCGYTSAKAIIIRFIKDRFLPASLIYPFVKLGAKLYGKFSLEKVSPIESVKTSKLPIIIFHGDKDNFVPYYMAEEIKKAATGECEVVTIANAGHGLAYMLDKEKYLNAIIEFENKINFKNL